MQIKIQHLKLNQKKKMVMISDIHGNLALFKELLNKIHYQEEDYLFILGDFLEKGPENLATLHFFMNWNNPNLYLVTGNCDYVNLELLENPDEIKNYILTRKNSLLKDMLLHMGCSIDEHFKIEEVYNQLVDTYAKEINWLKSLPQIIITDKFIFVHSGVKENVLDTDIYTSMKGRTFMHQNTCFERYVVVGHMPIQNYQSNYYIVHPVVDEKRKTIFIDGGNVVIRSGQLNAFLVDNEKNCQFKTDFVTKFPKALILENVEKTTHSTCFNWFNKEVELIELKEDTALVRSVKTNELVLILRKDLYCQDHIYSTYHGTNYFIEAKKEDIVYYIETIGENALVKKEGIIGLVPLNKLKIFE